MKKITSLALGFVLVPSFALAQSTADVGQEGGGNFASIEQTAASSAIIRQVGDGNVISSHEFENPPTGAFGQSGSTLTAEQYGNNNSLVGSQVNSTAGVYQNEASDHGDGNAAELTQSGGAYAVVEQEHYDDGSSYYEGNIARLTQAGASTAFMRQDGGDNIADARQDGDGNDISLNQQGRAMNATINQYGSGNVVHATQHNWNGTLDVEQDDTGNGVFVYQTAGKYSFNSATIRQDGTGNSVGQAGGEFRQTGDAILMVDQVGSGNTLMGSQASGMATVNQNGIGNTAIVIQQ